MNRAKTLQIFIIIITTLLLLAGCTDTNENSAIIDKPQESDYRYTAHNQNEAAFHGSIAQTSEATAAEAEFDENSYERCYCGDMYLHETGRWPTPPLNIEERGIDAEFLSEFENVHTFTYLQWEGYWYSTLAFWPDEPLRDFSFLSLDLNSNGERQAFHTREVLLNVEELLPSDVVVLNVLFVHYLIPRGGIVFTDESGVQRRMFIQDVSARGGCSQCFLGFILSPHDENHWADWK